MSDSAHNPADEIRFGCGLPENASADDKKASTDYRISAYRARPHWRNDTLSAYYADDFKDFTVDDFKDIRSDSRRELRDMLRNRGVYVPKGRGLSMSEGLFAVVQDDIPWPVDEDENPIADNTPENEEDGDENDETRNDNSEGSETTRRGNMANLFKAYSNDDDRYSGLTTETLTVSLCCSLNDVVKPISLTPIATVHFLLCLPGVPDNFISMC